MKGPSYGLAEVGVNCIEVFLRLHLLVFYTDTVHLNSSLAGIALGIAILWDALIDPFVGLWSDKVRNQTGKRYHFLLLGGVLVSAALYFLTHPMQLESQGMKFTYLLIWSILVNSGFTFLSVPYSALVGDISSSEKERSRLIGWRLGFANLGAILGIAIPSAFLVRNIPDPYPKSGIAISAIVLFTALTTWLFAKKYNLPRTENTSNHLNPWRSFKNPAFRKLLLAYFIANIALTFNSSLALYYYRLRLKFTEDQIQSVLLVFLLVFTLSIPLWLWLANKFSKVSAIKWGILLLGILGVVTYPLLPPYILWPTLLAASVFGGVFVGSSILLESLLTDIVKKEEEETKSDLLGMYFGVWKMGGKASRGVALALTGQILSFAKINSSQSENISSQVSNAAGGGENYLNLALAFGPLVSVFFILSVLLLWNFQIPAEKSPQS